MPFALEQLSQGLSLADKIDPGTVNNTSVTSTGIDLSKFRRAMFEIQVGSLGAAGTLDAHLESCALSNFASGVHNVSGSNITQVTANNKRVTVEIRDDELQAGDRYLRLNMTGGGNAITVGATGWAGEAEQKPAAKQGDIAAVTQRLVV